MGEKKGGSRLREQWTTSLCARARHFFCLLCVASVSFLALSEEIKKLHKQKATDFSVFSLPPTDVQGASTNMRRMLPLSVFLSFGVTDRQIHDGGIIFPLLLLGALLAQAEAQAQAQAKAQAPAYRKGKEK